MRRTSAGSPELQDVAPADRTFEDSSDSVDISRLLSAMRRQAGVFVLCCLLGLFAGAAYVLTAVPKFTAETDVILDKSQVRAGLDNNTANQSDGTFDTAAVDSQVEVLKSEKIALAVIDQLKLTDDADFMRTQSSLLGQIVGSIRSLLDVGNWTPGTQTGDLSTDFTKQRKAVGILQDNLDIARVGRTYVLGIKFTSPDVGKSATIANAFASAYLTDQLNSRYEATRLASDWLQQRINELRVQASDADLKVQKFRADNGLVSADGKLVSDQQLLDANAQLTQARSDRAQSEAKLKQIRAILDSHDLNATVTESLSNPIINDLRGKYFDASKRESELEAKLGPMHLQTISLRNQMGEYQRLIFEELGRIAQTYQSDAEVAKNREENLTKGVVGLVDLTATANNSQVQLRQLEQDADTYKTLYQTFLSRFQEAMQQQSFPMTDARIITYATPPQKPSQPKVVLVIALSLLLGGALGAGVGALREALDHAFRTGDQIREELGAEFFGMLPALGTAATRKKRKSFFSRKASADPGEIQVSQQAMRYVLDEPMSSFAETLRSVKVAADITLAERKPKIIGVISVLPTEGKSTISKNLASLLANQGSRTLLIDGDLRNPSLTRSVAPNAEAGILEAVLQGRPMQELLLREGESGLFILPAVVKRRISHTSDILSSTGMKNLIAQTAEHFDYVVVDLPPIGAVVDARAAASIIDGFVFVIEWGKTARRAVRNTFMTEDGIRERVLGVVLNKVQLKKLRMYENYGTTEYYHNRYHSYYRKGT